MLHQKNMRVFWLSAQKSNENVLGARLHARAASTGAYLRLHDALTPESCSIYGREQSLHVASRGAGHGWQSQVTSQVLAACGAPSDGAQRRQGKLFEIGVLESLFEPAQRDFARASAVDMPQHHL